MNGANADTVTLAPARVDALAPEQAGRLLCETDPHVFGCLHGHDEALAARHLGHQWTLAAGLFSHVHATAALHDGVLAGLELGFDRPTQAAHLEPFVTAAGAFLDEGQFARFTGFFEYGSQLLRACFERARAAGLARVQLDLYDGNPAERLYARAGMRTIVETRVPPLETDGVGLHRRMELKL